MEHYFSYFSTITYVMGTQKNHLNERVLMSTQNMLKLIGKKITIILRLKMSFSEPMAFSACVCDKYQNLMN